jgi:uncharacterized protein YgiB involved in biofilm formation
MPARPRKSSRHVTLVLLSAASVVACDQYGESLRRDVYATKNDCVADWGDQTQCDEQPATQYGGGAHGGYWYGPTYRSGQYGSSAGTAPAGTVDSARPGSHAVATSHVSRGGFGASGAAHGSGGS